MSYRDAPVPVGTTAQPYGITPLLLDVAALQTIYGPNVTGEHASDNTYFFLEAPGSTNTPYAIYQGQVKAIWDSAGRDTIDGSTFISSSVSIDLNQGHLSSIGGFNNVAIAFGTVIEDVKGGSGSDTLIGNDVGNRLEGNAGADTLQGGLGNDILIGGDGEDTYVINTGDGNDQIIDSGRSMLKRDGEVFAGVFVRDGNTNTYRFVTDNSVTISVNSPAILDLGNGDSVTFQDLTTAELVNQDLVGIRLIEESAAPTTTLTFTGDVSPTDTNPGTPGIQAASDGYGNPVGTAAPYADILLGSNSNDHMMSGELSDLVGAGAGDDRIEGGDGNDYLISGSGNDLIEGGAGSNVLLGYEDSDRLYGDVEIDLAIAIANGNDDSADSAKGDWLAGGSGDDILVTGATSDVLAGGGGNDVVIAGAGDDVILGDADYKTVYILDGDAPRYSVGSVDWYTLNPNTFEWAYTIAAGTVEFTTAAVGEFDPADSGADVVYAGAGADWVWAGAGDDVVYGDAGDDTLDGGVGNDALIGGAGEDVLWGGEGSDYLDGDDGNDTLWGGNGDDSLFGGAEDDKLYGEYGANYLDGEDGNDILNSGGPGSELFGGAGDDDISAAGGGNYLDAANDSDWKVAA